jgi:hypothetical protein
MNASGQPTMWVTLPTSGEPGIDMPPPTVNLAVCSVNAWVAACDSPILRPPEFCETVTFGVAWTVARVDRSVCGVGA